MTIALALAVILSANSRSVSHDVMELVKIVAEHQAETEQHGHSHEDVIDVIHAYQGHSHEAADHDHNIAFLPPRDMVGDRMPTSTSWATADHVMPGRGTYGLDRPPRM